MILKMVDPLRIELRLGSNRLLTGYKAVGASSYTTDPYGALGGT